MSISKNRVLPIVSTSLVARSADNLPDIFDLYTNPYSEWLITISVSIEMRWAAKPLAPGGRRIIAVAISGI